MLVLFAAWLARRFGVVWYKEVVERMRMRYDSERYGI